MSFPLFSFSRDAVSGHHFALMLIRGPVPQELNRRMVAELGVAATPVVEHFDAIEQIDLRIFPRCVARAMHPFVLQVVKETLRGRVVPAVALAAHRTHHVVFSELALERMDREPALNALLMATWRHPLQEIVAVHSDQGSQFSGKPF